MNPLALLLILMAITCVVAVIASQRRARRAAMLRAIANEAKYNFSLVDRFHLAERLERASSELSGAPVRLARDVMYRTLGTSVDPHRHFVFVAEIEPTAGEARIVRTISAVEEGAADSGLTVIAQRDAADAEAYRDLVRT
jgi:hypothetical protein